MVRKNCRWGVLGALGMMIGCFMATAAYSAAKPVSMPQWNRVEEVVGKYFRDKLPNYRSGEILSRSQVEPLFRELEVIGWRVAARKAVVEAVLPDNDPLVARLRTPAGRKFARQVAGVPQGYDRVYHLSHLPAGLKRVDNLIQGPDGYLLIKYMTTTKEGKNMSRMLSKNPGGKDFDKPTGRIYTDKMLKERLKKEYTNAAGTPDAPKPPRR